MMRTPLAALILIAIAWGARLDAQDHRPQFAPGEVRISGHPYQPPSAVLRSEARLVAVEVVVRDLRGKPVKGLSRDDFEIQDSGKKRDATAFSVETAATPDAVSQKQGDQVSSLASAPTPSASASGSTASSPATAGRSIALFFDDVNSPPSDLARAKIAASRFIKEELALGDRVAIFSTSTDQIVRFTTDTKLLLGAVHELQAHPRASSSGIGSCPRIPPYQAYQISSGDPGALQAAVLENCKCPGHDGSECLDIESMPAYQLSSSMAGGEAVGPGGSQVEGNIVAEVKTQASATWLQAKLVADATFDAVRKCVEIVGAMPGKRMVLIASSGFVSAELEVQEDAIVQEALRSSVVINALDAKGLYAESPTRPLNEASEASELHPLSMIYEARSLGDRLESQDAALARFAESTGGLFFHNNNDLNLGFYQLGVIPEVAYQLAFPPAEDGRYHKLRVELKNKNLGIVQARPGYFAPNGAAAIRSDPRTTLDHAVSGEEELNEVSAGVTLNLATVKETGRRLSVSIYVDTRRLPFQHQKDLQLEKLTFVAALYDVQGAFVTGKEAEMDLALKPESYQRLADSGITGMLSLDAPPGYYSLRSVVQESAQGKITATTKKVHIQ